MMSILIKNMEMPTRCEDCFCVRHNAEYDYAYCNISSVNVLGHGNARLNNCPLVEVPPHGDLIERQAVNLTDFEIVLCDGDYKEGMKMLLEKAASAPVIIPAEEGGETR